MRAPLLQVLPVSLRPGGLAALAAAHPQRYPVLLDSAANGPLASASLLAAFPSASLSLDGDGRLLSTGLQGQDAAPADGQFLTALSQWLARESLASPGDCTLPFRGGWFVYLGYEIAAEIEARLRMPSGRHLRAFALRVPMAIVALQDGQAYLVAEAQVPDWQLQQVQQDLLSTPIPEPPQALAIASIREEDPERFTQRVLRAQQYILAGDIYQANLSRRWEVQLQPDTRPGQVYALLRAANPAPFAALLQFGGLTLLSSSPERLVRIAQGRVDTRPIAGTHPRGATPEEDSRLAAQLLAHPKERAEHVMLIDLERNDLGRVCVAGSVHVDEYMGVETYAHVHHIVSNVTGQLRPDKGPVDVLRAVFPGGTITGCPKLRCMEIIAELEGEAREAYTGSMGYINLDGSADFNILIRTMMMDGDQISFRAGAGIVADSDPQRELQETRAKARGLLLALGVEGRTVVPRP